MVIVLEKIGKNVCFFPKNTGKSFMSMWLEIDDNGTMRSIDVEDEMCYKHWYTFILDLSRYPDGEYKYTLYGDGEVIGYGLLQIGNYVIEKKEYKQTHKIKEYNI